MQAKTKAAIIKAMVEATGWNPSLEAVVDQKIETSGKTTGGRAKKSSAKKGVDSAVLDQITANISQLTEKVQALEAQMQELKKGGSVKIGSSGPSPVSAPVSMSPKTTGKSELDMEIEILEAIPEELTFIDDVFDFVENIPKDLFLKVIKKLVLSKAIHGGKGEGEMHFELDDGTVISSVKR